jgi:glycosyltransferase involved in cell wall biosynthesis
MFSPEMARVVGDLSLSADVVHVARLHMVAQVETVIRHAVRPASVLDMDDVETTLLRRVLRAAPSIVRRHNPMDYLELVRLSAYEHQTVCRFDRVFVCSERDRDRFRRSNVVVVPNGTEVPSELPQNEPDGRTLLFCGVLSSRQNVDALDFFVQRILPEIRREIPDVKLLIVGRAPTPSVRRLDNGRSVLVRADVPSVGDYYRRALVAVVPLRIGAGTRLKILEAWALGVPVVSTSVGCEGLEAAAGEHLLVADEPQQFARSCVTLLQSPSLRQQLIARGRDLVERTYRWEAIDARVATITQELLER